MINGDFICIARSAVPHGLDGRFRIAVVSDNEERFKAGNSVILRSETVDRVCIIQSFEWHNGRNAFIKLEGIDDRTSAEAVAGSGLFITKDEAEASRGILADNEFYYYDLIDVEAYIDDRFFGRVGDVVDGGAGVLLSIKDDQGKEFLVPFVDEMVNTDRVVADKRIDLTPVPGLFDI